MVFDFLFSALLLLWLHGPTHPITLHSPLSTIDILSLVTPLPLVLCMSMSIWVFTWAHLSRSSPTRPPVSVWWSFLSSRAPGRSGFGCCSLLKHCDHSHPLGSGTWVCVPLLLRRRNAFWMTADRRTIIRYSLFWTSSYKTSFPMQPSFSLLSSISALAWSSLTECIPESLWL